MAENLENKTETTVETTDTTVETTTTTETQTTSTMSNEDFEKFAKYMDKRFEGLAKSMLKDNGADDDTVKEFISQYNKTKATKIIQGSDELKQLKEENNSLKKTILDGKLKSTAVKVAEEIGIDNKYITQVMKLADLSGVTDNGEINEAKLNEAMAKVIEECDAFKKTTTSETKGFKNIGGTFSDNTNEDGLDKVRKIMGLNKK